MKFWLTAKGSRAGGKFAAVALMLTLWVVTSALAASPELHRLLHQDAQGPNHHCLVTQLQQHQSVFAPGVVALVPSSPWVGLESVCFGDFHFLPSRDYRLSPSRAPPSV